MKRGLGTGGWGLESGASNCREWRERIAGDPDDSAAAQHSAVCDDCREFAKGLGEALAELREAHSEEVPPAVYAAVRARVLAELRPRRKWSWLWAVAGVAALVLGIAVTERMRVEELRVVARAPVIPAADLRLGPMTARMPAWRAGGSLYQQRKEEIVMKIETADSDVVIYWIAEAKGEE